MPRDRKIPAYSRCTDRGHSYACVTLYDRLTGRRSKIRIGEFGTAESRQQYDRVIAEWTAAGRRLPAEADYPRAGHGPTVGQIADAFLASAAERYSASELGCYRAAIRFLSRFHSLTPAARFGPMALRALRSAMMRDEPDRVGWCRKTAARQTARIVAVFRWAASYQLLPYSIWESLRSIDPLRRGAGREYDPIRPADSAAVKVVRGLVSRTVRDLIDLQLATGARPGELLIMRPGDIERGRSVWVYRPSRHKLFHVGKAREIVIGPRARKLLAPLIAKLAPDALVFPGYSVDSYRRAIARACANAAVPHWHPHQLRHTVLTRLRREHGAEAARIIAGHSDIDTTLIYAERDAGIAQKVARISG